MASNEHEWDTLPELFCKILHLWKESPAHNNWAMEKLMEIFCNDIAPNMKMVQSVGFPAFLDGFFDSGQLIQYPDFVMVNVALMAGEVLLTGSSQEETMKAKAFSLIRYPLQYWLVDKGHNAHVTFQILSKFVQNRVMFSFLSNSSYDLPQAVAYAVASPHNYTRKSACTYFHTLVHFAFNKTNQDTETQVELRTQITQCIESFARRLNQAKRISSYESDKVYPEDKESETVSNAKARLSQLVCQSACASQEWLEVIFRKGILTLVLELCCQIAGEEHEDGEGLYLTCAQMLVKLQTSTTLKELWNRHCQLFLEVVKTVCQQGSATTVIEVLGVALTLLVGLSKLTSLERSLFFELSVLPLFALVSVKPVSVQKFSPEIIVQVESIMVGSDMSRPLPLMKEAVKNLFSILDNEMLYSQEYAHLLKYLTLQELAEPAGVTRGLLCGSQLRSAQVVNFLQYSFPHLQGLENKNHKHVENILIVLECFMTQPRLTHVHIQKAMDCYVKLVKDTGGIKNEAIFSILQVLQLKMVDVDSNIQEVAVKAVGNLLLLDSIDITSSQMSQCARALWQCSEHKAEEVASQVLRFLSKASTIGKLNSFLSSVSVSEVEVVHKAEEFLLNNQWDNIKPVAFKLLTKLCTANAMLKYAQASFKWYNAQLRVEVLDYMKSTFEEACLNQCSLKQQVETIMSLLSIGWGDLLIDKAVSVETCNFRQVSGIMETLSSFFDREDVCHYIDMVILELMLNLSVSKSENSKDVRAFLDICYILLSLHGHIVNHDLKESCHGHESMQIECRSDVSSSGEPPTKKIKSESTSLHNRASFGKLLSSNAQNLLMWALNEALVGQNISAEYKNATAVVEENAFDSTKELTPLQVPNKQALSRKIILESLSPEVGADTERVCDIITWLVYKEILHNLQPKAMNREAERSTDEYERNRSLLLHDFHKLLNKSFLDMKEDLKEELASVLMERMSDILAQFENVKSFDGKTPILRSMIFFLETVNKLLSSIDKFYNFVFDHRKSFILDPMQREDSQFILDTFLGRLQALRCIDARQLLVKDTYPLKEGLSLLLDKFCHEHMDTNCSVNDKYRTILCEEYSFCEKEDHMHNFREKLEQVISGACNQVIKSNFSVLDKLTLDDTKTLHKLVTNNFEFISPEDAFKGIMSEGRSFNLPSILVFVQIVCKKIILESFQNNSIQENSETVKCIQLFLQLRAWLLSDREVESDNDDDPTALDCF